MAICGRVGLFLRQSISPGQGWMGIRWMSSTKIFVGGLSLQTDGQSLREAFSGFGDVVTARVIADRETGSSKGFGFVQFTDAEAATSAVSAMNGQEINGRILRVNIAQDNYPGTRTGGAGNRSNGGF